MALKLSNPEAHRLAQELAALTSESMTVGAAEAMRERLDYLRRERRTGLAGRLLEIGRGCSSRLKEPYRSADSADLLYDEKGLPR